LKIDGLDPEVDGEPDGAGREAFHVRAVEKLLVLEGQEIATAGPERLESLLDQLSRSKGDLGG
jgi:hypothetical protein